MPALLLSLLPLLLKYVPDLVGLAFGGNAQAVLEKVEQAATSVFGTQDPTVIQGQLAADPAKADALAARLQADTDALKAELADTQNARSATVSLAQAGSQIAWGAPIVSAVVTGGFVAIVGIMSVRAIPDSAVANVLVGTLATAFGSVVNYWLGSSAGSRLKTDQLATLAHAAAGPPAKRAGR